MRQKATLIVILAALLLLAVAGYLWMRDAPRRTSLATLARLDHALHGGSTLDLFDLIVLPAAVRGQSRSEQCEFLFKSLNDEISPEGLAALRKQGDYGPLRQIFPAEAEGWARQAGVNPDECVAFKMERRGLHAEVVLLHRPESETRSTGDQAEYRILRLNNVRQMADPNLVPAEN